MDTLLSLLSMLNGLSPLAIIALLVMVLGYQMKTQTKNETAFSTITDNHLHELPEMLKILQRIETNQAAAFATIIAQLDFNRRYLRDKESK